MNLQRLQEWFGVVAYRLTFLRTTTPQDRNYQIWCDRFVRRRLTLGIWLVLSVYLTFATLELGYFLFERDRFNPDWFSTQIVTLVLVVVCAIGFRSGIALVWLSLAVNLTPILQRTLAGALQPSLLVWPLMFLGQATLIPVRWHLHLISQLMTLTFYFSAWGLGVPATIPLDRLTPFGLVLYLGWTCAICDLSVFLYERVQRSEFMARCQLQEAYDRLSEEQARSERLLLNILPRPIAKRLKEQTRHCAIADSFANAGVLFADIVGFTELSGRISPPELVQLLNEIFSEFDRLADSYGLEKIKTIGDAYMVVSGLPEPRDDFDEAIADMGLEMKQALMQFNTRHQHQFQMRIGIATGPVVAGVIGLKKFIYDLWGDTVNLASRMESHGIPDAIQVTADTYERLKDRYDFRSRGSIEVKGKGSMTTYLLLRKRPSVAPVAISPASHKKNAQE